MNVLIRVDSSREIGLGHLKRSMLLASHLKQNGWNAFFVCRDHDGNLNQLVIESGFDLYRLQTNTQYTSENLYERWLGDSPSSDSSDFINIARNIGSVDLVIVDHYGIDSAWHNKIKNSLGCKILVIDDLANRTYDCDILLDQTLGRLSTDFERLVSRNCIILAGTSYALINEIYSVKRMKLEKRDLPKQPRILVSMGGTDLNNVSEFILDSLVFWSGIKNAIVTVVGMLSEKGEEIFSNLSCVERYHYQYTERMPELIENHDLCIGALGSSSWERCCLGLPSIAILTAENQRSIASALDKSGAIKYVGEWQSLNRDYLLKTLDLVLKNKEIYEEMSMLALKVCDGKGLDRVFTAILNNTK